MNIEKLVFAMKSKREEEGLSIRKLAPMIGVSFSGLARVERGEGRPDHNTAVRILNWLGDDAERYGVKMEEVALVHFRAAKNASSKAVEHLLQIAKDLKRSRSTDLLSDSSTPNDQPSFSSPDNKGLSKSEMEAKAQEIRELVGIKPDEPLPALKIKITGVEVVKISDLEDVYPDEVNYLCNEGSSDWSAMSVPLDIEEQNWVVLRNDTHTPERQAVTYLEECWHILLGHKLTKVAKIAGSYGRTYESTEEHDAFYLASATLLPADEVREFVTKGKSAAEIGAHFGTSPELAEYRIKRLGLWTNYRGIQVKLED